MTLAQQYPFTVYATTPGGHRFAVASYPTRDAALQGKYAHGKAHPFDRTVIIARANLLNACQDAAHDAYLADLQLDDRIEWAWYLSANAVAEPEWLSALFAGFAI